MVASHLHSFLNSRNIPFISLPFGVQIEYKYYDFDIFRSFNIHFIDATFVIDYPK